MHELADDGSNIAYVLEHLLRDSQKKRMLTNLLAQCLPFVEDISIRQNLDHSLTFRIQEIYQHRIFAPIFRRTARSYSRAYCGALLPALLAL
jgi:hypothetical protein